MEVIGCRSAGPTEPDALDVEVRAVVLGHDVLRHVGVWAQATFGWHRVEGRVHELREGVDGHVYTIRIRRMGAQREAPVAPVEDAPVEEAAGSRGLVIPGFRRGQFG